MLSRKERTLAGLLLVVAAVAAARGPLYRQVVQPLVDKSGEVASAEARVSQAELQLQQLEAARLALAELREDCLPAGGSRATVAYQERLMELCETAGLREPVVSPLQTAAMDSLGDRVSFVVSGDAASTAEAARMVGLLDGDGVRNRVTLMSIERVAEGRHRVSMNVEVLAVDGGGALRRLPAPQLLQTSLDETVVENDPFRRGYNGPQPVIADVPVEPEPEPDPREFVRLVGLVEFRGELHAWLVDSRDGSESSYKANDLITLQDWEARVLGFEDGELQVDVAGNARTLKLGDLLIDLDG